MNDIIAKDYDRIILKNKCKIEEDCSICLESLYQKQVMCLPCQHYFHHSCLKQALEQKLYTCPLCRYDLTNALMKTDFKFPVVYNPHVFNDGVYGMRWTYTSESYTIEESDDDSMPDLVASDDESNNLSEWSDLLFNIMRRDNTNYLNPAVPIQPLASATAEAPAEAPHSIIVDYVSSVYDVDIPDTRLLIFYSL
jgi:hypothetical protein